MRLCSVSLTVQTAAQVMVNGDYRKGQVLVKIVLIFIILEGTESSSCTGAMRQDQLEYSHVQFLLLAIVLPRQCMWEFTAIQLKVITGNSKNIQLITPSLIGSLSATLTYDPPSHTLSCVSSGGPVNTVTWRRNGDLITSTSPYQLSQSLMSGVTSTFLNVLTITGGDIEDYNGTFSCTVSNSRGPSPIQSLDIHSM